MDTLSNEVAGNVVSILVLSIVAGIAVMIILAGLTAGVLTGGAIGLGYSGFKFYKRKQLGDYDERGDAAGTPLYARGGLFVGEEETWP